jgi:phosphatidylglycerophosphate synthase
MERTDRRIPGSRTAVIADSLTGTRLLLGPLLVGLLGAGDALGAAAATLAFAWATDFADGRMARRASGDTRLGPWDPIADSIVGIGVLSGLVVSGRVGAPWLIGALSLFVVFVLTRNLAFGMVVQAVAYGLFIVELAVDAPGALWMLGATAAVIGVADARRFIELVLPTFFSGLGLSRARPPE